MSELSLDPVGQSLSQADLHMHTCYSDGWPTPQAVVEFAQHRTPLSLIAITDHDTIEGALRAAEYAQARETAPLVIIGEEVSSRDGHILGLFLTRPVEPGKSAAATVDAIHEQGGLAVAPHPFWRSVRQAGARNQVYGVGWLAAKVDFDAIEVENATPGLYVFNQIAHQLREQTSLPGLGGSDAHILDAIGRAYTSFPGHGAEALRQAIIHSQTHAHRARYRAMGLVRYAAWSIERRRQRRLAEA
jgi:predicted metal-dependent phosphoesterase TrpH